MRRVPRPLPSVLVAVAVFASGCAETAKSAPAATGPERGDAVVELVGLEFEPRTVQVPLGSRVLWRWTDSVVHNVVSSQFASSEVLDGGTYAVRFERAGRYPYRCTLHTGMDGTVVVTP